jgi:hypothetical protein
VLRRTEYSLVKIIYLPGTLGYAVAQLVEALCYKPEGRRLVFR